LNRLTIKIILSWFLVIIISCGGKEKSTPIGLRVKPISIKEFDVPPGADPNISAELGGNGFDEIATNLGWETSSPNRIMGSNDAKKGGRFTTHFTEFPASLRAYGKDSNYEVISLMSSLVYESLLSIDSETFDLKPMLCSHWKISEDFKTFQLRIDPKARWADGKRVTTDDILATYKLLTDETILQPYYNVVFEKYTEPKIISKYIVEISSKEVHFKNILDFAWGMALLPAHYIDGLSGSEYLEKFHFKMMPGTGPYTLQDDKIKKGKSIALTRRTDWWQASYDRNTGLYNFDELKFIIVQDDRLSLEKFKKGEFDAYTIGRAQWWVEEFDLTNQDFDYLHRGLIQKRKIFNNHLSGTSGLAFNMREGRIFNDINLRLVMAKLWNRQQLIEKLFFNEYVPIKSYFPGGQYENQANELVTYDPEGAVELLTKSGWSDRNKDGWLVKDGQIFEIDFGIDQSMERIFTPYQEDLAKVGIKMNLKYIARQTMFKNVMNERDFDIHYQGWTMPTFPNPETHYGSEAADQSGTTNITGFKSNRVDEISSDYKTMFNPKDRIDALREVDKIVYQSHAYALGWRAPYSWRCGFWNKFGMPDHYLGYSGNWKSAYAYWWYEPKLATKVYQAKDDKSITFPHGNTEIYYNDLEKYKN